MKLIKRITAAVTVLGMLPTLVFAIKPSEMVSVNSRVVVQQDSVAVFSHPIMESYGIKSADLLSALSADGYTLKYVNSNLQETTAAQVMGGYILAEDAYGSKSYIPITKRTDNIAYDDFSDLSASKFTAYNNGGSGIKIAAQTGVGGRAADDVSYVISADGTTSAGSNGTYIQYPNPFKVDTVYTMEVAVYNNSDARLGIRAKAGSSYQELIYLDKNGELTALNLAGSNNTQKAAGTLAAGEWHRIAFTADPVRNRCYVYADGALVGDYFIDMGSQPQYEYFQLKMYNALTAKVSKGDIAFDDFSIYRGYYTYNEQKLSASSEQVYIDNAARLVCGVIGRTAENINGAINVAPAGMVRTVTKDGKILADDETAQAGNKLWICDSDGNYSAEYSIAEADYSTEVALGQNDEYTSAEITVCPAEYGNDITTALIIAQYKNGSLISVGTSGDRSYSGLSKLSAQLENSEESGVITKVFLLDGLHTQKPLKKARTIGSKTLVSVDFETESVLSQMYLNHNGNTIEIVDDTEDNKACHIKMVNQSGSYIDARGLSSSSDFVVYEFDLKLANDVSRFAINLKDSAAAFQALGNLNGRTVTFYNGMTRNIDDNGWHRISFAADYYSRVITAYFDDAAVGSFEMASGYAAGGAQTDLFRVQAVSNFSDSEYYIDNYRVYESLNLKYELAEQENVIDLSITKSVFESDAPQKQLLSGYKAIHTRSGVVFNGAEKSVLENPPYTQDGEVMIPYAELNRKLGVTLDGTALAAAKENAVINGGAEYIPFSLWLEIAQKTATEVTSEYNSGLVVIGDGSFAAPTDADAIQKLNDYVFYLRPTTAQIKSAYKSSQQYQQHPRILATAEDFERLRGETETNANKKKLKECIIAHADVLLDKPAMEYELDPDTQLIGYARSLAGKMFTLGMAYQLTGEQKYADRVWLDLEAASGFIDWAPSNHLCPVEIGCAVAIGYDWCYSGLSAEQRQTVEEGMYKHLFYPAWQSYLSEGSIMSNSATAGNNHSNVCNGGIAMSALAMMDVYPEETAYLVSNALRGVDLVLYHFAPEGAWFEGVSYWEYTMQFTVRLLSSMQTSLGTMLGYEKIEGLSTAGDYMIYMQSPGIGLYNYADSTPYNIWAPEMYWLANTFHDDTVTKACLKFEDQPISSWEDYYYWYGGHVLEDYALRLLWYDVNVGADDISDMPLDRFYASEDTITMRDSWNTKPTFVGIHAGITNVPHAHLDAGSFIFHSGGKRWSVETGMGNYTSEGYWDDSVNGMRWKHFPVRAEAHSTIVINPDENPDHAVDSYAKMTVVDADETGGIVTVDMSDVLRRDVNAATRGFFFTDNRSSLVVRDELDLKAQSDVYWFMIMEKNVTMLKLSDTSYVLNYSGTRLRLDFVTDADTVEVTHGAAEPLPTSPVMSDDTPLTDYKRFAIKLNGSGKVNLTVKLTPYSISGSGSSVSDYNVPIDSWKLCE